MALPEAAVPLVPVGLRIDGKAFGQPTGLQQIWKRARKERKENSGQDEKSAEYSTKDKGRALCLVQMNDVGEFVREHQFQPLAVLQQLAFGGRRQDDADEIERQRRGVPIRKIKRVQHHDLRA